MPEIPQGAVSGESIVKYYLRVRTTQQLNTAISWGRAHALLLDGALAEAPVKDIPDGVQQYVCLPDVARQSRLRRIENLLQSLPEGTGVVVRNLDELGMLQQMAYQGTVIGDSFLYAYNSQAIAFYSELFPGMRFIGSDELTVQELRSLEVEKDRMILKVYGCQPLMISNQCLNRNYSECREQKRFFSGNRGEPFFVQSSCSQCYSTVFNGVCTWLGGRPELDAFENVLYDFTGETPGEMQAILEQGRPRALTRGHFEKGIE